MIIKKVKNLVKQITLPEAIAYCNSHPQYKIPDALDAVEFDYDACEHKVFWTTETLGDRAVIYDKKNHCFHMSHPMFKHNVVLKRVEQ